MVPQKYLEGPGRDGQTGLPGSSWHVLLWGLLLGVAPLRGRCVGEVVTHRTSILSLAFWVTTVPPPRLRLHAKIHSQPQASATQ